MSILFSPVDKASSVDLRDQVCEKISLRISQGLLKPGLRLPSCRKAAAQLGVSRNTVVSAYHALIYDGLVEARERSGYFVHRGVRSAPFARANEPACAPQRLFDRLSPTVTPSGYNIISRPGDWSQYPYPFVCNQMDAARFPLADWRKCNYQVLNRGQTAAVTGDHQYSDCAELVTQIRTRLLPRRGIVAGPDEILLTAGAQQAIYVLSQLLGGPGRRIAVEDPCYAEARNIFNLFFGDVRPINLDGEGLVCDQRLADCDLVYVTPNHQYPTSLRMSGARRKQLLDHAKRHNVVIVEDDYDCETDFDPLIKPALKASASDNLVIYIGSLSKSLSPGLRLGYMVAPADFIREARALRGMMIRHLPPQVQLTTARFIRLGHHDAFISRLQGVYERRWHAANTALRRLFPDVQITSGWGGTNFMITAPKPVNLTDLAPAALAAGVVIDPIQVCFETPGEGTNIFRLGVSAIGEKKITKGLERLRGVYDRFVG